MLILIKVLTWAASPTGFLVWGVLLGLLLTVVGWRKFGRTLMAFSILQLVVLASPFVSDSLLGRLENQTRDLAAQNSQAQRILSGQQYSAIVVLGGAIAPMDPPRRPHPDLNAAGDRIWHGARLFKKGLAPKIILSGGRGPGLEDRRDIQTEAQAMRVLLLDFAIPESALVLEDASRTTRENAAQTKRITAGGPVALVTSAFHMPRALKTFERAGVPADAYPTDFRVAPQLEPLWSRLLPRASALTDSETAIKEYIAIVISY
jgi:uncharacterized SAM-binding protein YcdF (DUF218 family)